jgi:four helix bundle protein
MDDATQEQRRALERRLILFSVHNMRLIEDLPKSFGGRRIAGELFRSATSPSPENTEVQPAQPPADFNLRMKDALKELKESNIWLQIIKEQQLLPDSRVDEIIEECAQLTRLVAASIEKPAPRKRRGAAPPASNV